eukprot:746115-Hanusia_phi.AAC.10
MLKPCRLDAEPRLEWMNLLLRNCHASKSLENLVKEQHDIIQQYLFVKPEHKRKIATPSFKQLRACEDRREVTHSAPCFGTSLDPQQSSITRGQQEEGGRKG